MIYRGSFLSIHNQLYTVSINAGGSTVKEIEFGKNPLSVAFDTDDVYKPLKLSKAQITIETEEILSELSAVTAKQIPVSVTDKSGSTVFAGYITPNNFNQGYLEFSTSLELECVDPLSVLEHYKYKTDTIGIVSFLDVFKKAFAQAGLISRMFVHNFSDSYKLQDLYISEQNWFDEDDEAMTYKEVLEAIMRYLGLTIFVYRGTPHIVDYDLLRKGNFSFYSYSGANLTQAPEMYTLTSLVDLSSKTIYSGSSISHNAISDKVTIRASLYNTGSEVPDPFDTDDLKVLSAEIAEDDGRGYACILQPMKSDTWKQLYYNSDFTPSETPTSMGGNIQRWLGYKWADGRPAKNNWNYCVNCVYTKPEPIYHSLNLNKPILTYHDAKLSSFSNVNFSIYAELYFTWQNTPREQDKADGRVSPNNIKVPVEFRIGKNYWNGAAWQTTQCTFNVGFDYTKENSGGNYCQSWTWIKATDSNVYENNTPDLKGHIIKVGTNIVFGDVEVKIYSPLAATGASMTASYWPTRVLMRDVTFKQQSPNTGAVNGEADDTDTIYEAMINEDSVAKLDDIDLKVTTYTGKGMSYSAVMTKTSLGYEYLGLIRNNGLNQSKLQEYNLLDKYIKQYSTSSRAMTHEVIGVIPPYSRLTDPNFPGKYFILDKVEYDYKQDTSVLSIIEKQ